MILSLHGGAVSYGETTLFIIVADKRRYFLLLAKKTSG